MIRLFGALVAASALLIATTVAVRELPRGEPRVGGQAGGAAAPGPVGAVPGGGGGPAIAPSRPGVESVEPADIGPGLDSLPPAARRYYASATWAEGGLFLNPIGPEATRTGRAPRAIAREASGGDRGEAAETPGPATVRVVQRPVPGTITDLPAIDDRPVISGREAARQGSTAFPTPPLAGRRVAPTPSPQAAGVVAPVPRTFVESPPRLPEPPRAEPALLLELVDLDDPVVVGQDVTYRIRVVNQGGRRDGAVRVVVRLPEGLRFVDATGPSAARSAGRVVAFEPVEALDPGEELRWLLAARAERAGQVSTRAELESDFLATAAVSVEPTTLLPEPINAQVDAEPVELPIGRPPGG